MRAIGNAYRNQQGPLVVGAATGGFQGTGTINAQGLFVNGVAVAGGAAVASVTGTANQVTASPTTGAVIVGLPQNVIVPTPASGVGLTVTAVSGGNLSGLVVSGSPGTAPANPDVGRILTIANSSTAGADLRLLDIGQTGANAYLRPVLAGAGPAAPGLQIITVSGGTTFASAGNITINAPASGTALLINQSGSTQGLVVAAAAASSAVIAIAGNGATAANWLFLDQDTSNIGYLYNAANAGLNLGTNNTGRINIAAAGAVTILAPASGIALTVNAPTNGIGINNVGQFLSTGIGNTAFDSNATFNPTFNSGASSRADVVLATASTVNAAYTIPQLDIYQAQFGTKGASSAITNIIGFDADGSIGTAFSGAVNTFGFQSNIAVAANNWNFYAKGTAANFFQGAVTIGAPAASTVALTIIGSSGANNNALSVTTGADISGLLLGGAVNNVSLIWNNTAAGATAVFRISSSATGSGFGAGNLVIGDGTNNRLSLSGSGNFILGATAPSSGITLSVNAVSGTHSTKIADSATNLFNAGFLEIPQNSQSVNYTTVLSDSGKHIYHPSADTTARTWTIAANASVAYPIGTAITFDNDTSAGVITLAITTDTLVWLPSGTTGSRSIAANGQATALKVTATRWHLTGVGIT